MGEKKIRGHFFGAQRREVVFEKSKEEANMISKHCTKSQRIKVIIKRLMIMYMSILYV